MTDYLETENLVAELLKLKASNDAIVCALTKRIRDLEKRNDEKNEITFVYFLFFRKNPELIPELVELAYKEEPQAAKATVEAYHDDTLDLSTLEVTGKDFKPWRA